MPGPKDVSRPIDAYKAIIDQLVVETSQGTSERLVSQEGIFSRSSSEDENNSFVRTLSLGDKQKLARILHAERTAAIHDVLALLSWWNQNGGLSFAFHGEKMPVDLSGMGLHGDYAGRQQGWKWPK